MKISPKFYNAQLSLPHECDAASANRESLVAGFSVRGASIANNNVEERSSIHCFRGHTPVEEYVAGDRDCLTKICQEGNNAGREAGALSLARKANTKTEPGAE